MSSQHSLSRTELLIGREAIEKLKNSRVVVFGVGGVGSYTVESLARGGVQKIVIVDDDTVCLTNINRQIHATFKTLSRPKVEVMKERILEINPHAEVTAIQKFAKEEDMEDIITPDTDYVVDAVDTVTTKIQIVCYCKSHNIKVISCMGAGNKMDPTRFKVADLYETKICPLAKVMRYELKRRGIKDLKVVYSEEVPMKPKTDETVTCKECCVCSGGSTGKCKLKRQIAGSNSFVPPVAGLIIGGEVMKDIIGYKG